MIRPMGCGTWLGFVFFSFWFAQMTWGLDLFWHDQAFFFSFAVLGAIIGAGQTSGSRLHELYLEKNALRPAYPERR